MNTANDFSPIKKIIKERQELLLESCNQFKMIPRKTGKFYMRNELIRGYLAQIRKHYSLPTTNAIFKVMAELASRSNKHGLSFPALKTIMREVVISNKNYLIKILKIMEDDLNMIKTFRGKGSISNVYMLTDHTRWTLLDGINKNLSVSKEPQEKYQDTNT